MAALWSDEGRYNRWRRVETAVVAARVRAGLTSPEVLALVEEVPAPSPAAVEAVEARVRHDVVAFVDAWTAGMDASVASHVHRHLTSSDVVDTAQACAVRDATDLILSAAGRLVVALADRALEHRDTLCVARTHGQAASFDVVGHRFADFAFAADRAAARLASTRATVAVVNLSGPVGVGAGLPPPLVADVATALGLAVAPSTTQVVFRDGLAAWVADLALLGAVCEAVALDVRLGQHDGVAELAEPRRPDQEGSSAMPHKRNPITAENVTGIARLLRGYVGPALEDVALWQHRDLSHSSVERVVLPDAGALCEHALRATARMVEGLVVDENAIRMNMVRAGGVLASNRLQVAELTQGVGRVDAARAVRTRLEADDVSADVEGAAADVLNSEVLAETFEQVAALRRRHQKALDARTAREV